MVKVFHQAIKEAITYKHSGNDLLSDVLSMLKTSTIPDQITDKRDEAVSALVVDQRRILCKCVIINNLIILHSSIGRQRLMVATLVGRGLHFTMLVHSHYVSLDSDLASNSDDYYYY